MTDDKPQQKYKMPFTDLWERTSAKGTVYYSGFIGGLRVIGFRETLADKNQPVIRLFLQEGDKPMAETVSQREWAAKAAGASNQAGRPSNPPRAAKPDVNDEKELNDVIPF